MLKKLLIFVLFFNLLTGLCFPVLSCYAGSSGTCLAPVSSLRLKNSLSYIVSGIMRDEKYPLDYKIEKVKFVLKNHSWFKGSNIEKDFYANNFFIWFIDHKRNEAWRFSLRKVQKEPKPQDVVDHAMITQDIAVINEVIKLLKDLSELFYTKYPKKVLNEIKTIQMYADTNLIEDVTRGDVAAIIKDVLVLIKSVNWGAFSNSSDNKKIIYKFVTSTVIKKLRDHKLLLNKRLKALTPKTFVYYEPKVKSLKTISLVANLLSAEGGLKHFSDIKREKTAKLIDEYNKKNSQHLNIYMGRITPEEKILNGSMYVRFDVDDMYMGFKIDRDEKITYMPRKIFMEQEIQDKIKQLKHDYQDLFSNNEELILDNLFNFMHLSGFVVSKERTAILNYLKDFKQSKKDRLEYVDNWFHGFVMSRDHGFIHALMDLELVFRQLQFAINPKNQYRMKGKKVVLYREGKSVASDEIAVKVEDMIYATMLHDVTSILRRDEHHLSGAYVARKILRNFNFQENQINDIVNMILRHRGKRHIPAVSFSEQLLEKGDTAAAAEIDRLYYKASDLKQSSIIDTRITTPYRMLVNSGVFEHESFTQNQSTDPITFYMYSIMFRCFKDTGEFTYEGFEPVESLLPDILDKEINSLKRQIKFDYRFDKAQKNKYLAMIDMLFDTGQYLLQNYTLALMHKYDELFPLFKLPPYTDLTQAIKSKSDMLDYLIDSKRRKFLSLPKEDRDQILYSVLDVLKISAALGKAVDSNYAKAGTGAYLTSPINMERIEQMVVKSKTLATAA